MKTYQNILSFLNGIILLQLANHRRAYHFISIYVQSSWQTLPRQSYMELPSDIRRNIACVRSIVVVLSEVVDSQA